MCDADRMDWIKLANHFLLKSTHTSRDSAPTNQQAAHDYHYVKYLRLQQRKNEWSLQLPQNLKSYSLSTILQAFKAFIAKYYVRCLSHGAPLTPNDCSPHFAKSRWRSWDREQCNERRNPRQNGTGQRLPAPLPSLKLAAPPMTQADSAFQESSASVTGIGAYYVANTQRVIPATQVSLG